MTIKTTKNLTPHKKLLTLGIIPIGIVCFILIISLTQNVIYAFVALFSSIILAILC